MTAVVVVAVARAATVDQPPVARADVVEVRAGGKVAVPVLENDYDPEGGVLEVVSVTPFDGADTAPGLNGQTVDVRVGAGVISSFTLSYTVADEAGNQSSAFLEVRIVPADEVNRPPIARTDTGRTRSGVPVLIEVVANDSDPDGDIIAAESIRTQPTGGTARVEDGAVVYTPSDTFTGTDRFAYALVDAGGEIGIGEVLVGVMPLAGANRAPGGLRRHRRRRRGECPARVRRARQRLRPRRRSCAGDHGRRPVDRRHVVADDGGAVMFTPPATITTGDGTAAEIAFTYGIDDGRGGTASATVTVARGDGVRADRAGRRRRPDRAAQPRGDRRRRRARQRPRPRRQSGRAHRQLQRPRARRPRRQRGHDHGRHHLGPARLHDHRRGRADRPGRGRRARRAQPGAGRRGRTGQTTSDQPLTLDLADPAVDPDGDTLYFTCCDNPRGGAATTVRSGPGELVVSFDPDDAFAGPATFAFSVDDQEGHTVAGSVTVEVLAPANRPPAATDGSFTVEAGVPTNVDLASLVTDPDPDRHPSLHGRRPEPGASSS